MSYLVGGCTSGTVSSFWSFGIAAVLTSSFWSFDIAAVLTCSGGTSSLEEEDIWENSKKSPVIE